MTDRELLRAEDSRAEESACATEACHRTGRGRRTPRDTAKAATEARARSACPLERQHRRFQADTDARCENSESRAQAAEFGWHTGCDEQPPAPPEWQATAARPRS